MKLSGTALLLRRVRKPPQMAGADEWGRGQSYVCCEDCLVPSTQACYSSFMVCEMWYCPQGYGGAPVHWYQVSHWSQDRVSARLMSDTWALPMRGVGEIIVSLHLKANKPNSRFPKQDTNRNTAICQKSHFSKFCNAPLQPREISKKHRLKY